MATLRAVILIGCLVFAASDRPVDKFGNPCLPGGTSKPTGLPALSHSAEVGLGIVTAVGAAAAGTAAAIETNPKLKVETEEAAGDAYARAKKGFQAFSKKGEKAFEEFPDSAKKVFDSLGNELTWEHVTAMIKFDVQLPTPQAATQFVSNPEVRTAAEQGIAVRLQIPVDWVTASLSSTLAKVAAERRLTTTVPVVLDINIAVPLTEPRSHQVARELSREVLTITKTNVLTWLQRFLSPVLAMRVAAASSAFSTTMPYVFDSSSGFSGDSSASLNSASSQEDSSGSGLSGSSGFYTASYWCVALVVLLCGSLTAFALMQAGKPRSGKARTRNMKRSAMPEAIATDVEAAPGQQASVEAAPLLPLQLPQLQPGQQVVPQFGMIAPMAQASYQPAPTVQPPHGPVRGGSQLVAMPSMSMAPPQVMNPAYTAQLPILAEVAPSYAPPMMTQNFNSGRAQMVAPPIAQRSGPGRRPSQGRPSSPSRTPPVPGPFTAAARPQAGSAADFVFGQIDRNHDGVITRDELREAVRSGVVSPGHP